MQVHMKQDGVLVGGLQGLHFELFGIVNNFSMELINTRSTKMLLCSSIPKDLFVLVSF
jgi:hypothetical protein